MSSIIDLPRAEGARFGAPADGRPGGSRSRDEAPGGVPTGDARLERVSDLLRAARQRLEGAVAVLHVGDELGADLRERHARTNVLCADACSRLAAACALLGGPDDRRAPATRGDDGAAPFSG